MMSLCDFQSYKRTKTTAMKKVDGFVDELLKLWKKEWRCEKFGEAERGFESGFIRFLEVIINV